MIHKILRIAELSIELRIPEELPFPDSLQPFFTAGDTGKADLILETYYGIPPADICKEGNFISFGINHNQNYVIQRFLTSDSEAIYRVEPRTGEEPWRLYFPESYRKNLLQNSNWLVHMALERMLLLHDRVLLHASSVILNGEAWVFTAPSGGGKSTHAGLWNQYLGAEWINGDKTLLRIGEEGLMAYGSPSAGTSGIYRNVGAPVKAIVVLEKGPDNCLIPITKRQAYLNLYGQMVKCSWDEDFNRHVLFLTEQILQQVPVVRYQCTKEPAAAQTLLQLLNDPQ